MEGEDVTRYGATWTSTLIGRGRELAKIRERFDEGALLTLVGAAGMGKTHVALAYAASVASSYDAAGGAWFVDLTHVYDREAFLDSVAFALGAPVGDASPDDRSAWVDDRLRMQATVLVLDNFEQLVDECADVVDRWTRASRSKVLVTSRARLGVPAERVLSLEPLGIEAATELFLRRMRDLDTLSAPIDRSAAQRIVEAVDRMPLAIELAASRTSVLTLGELAERLVRPLEILRSATGRPARHDSVERAVHDSVALLSDAERRVFALLSVFADGARTSDVEAVLGGVTELAPLDALERLGRVSLVRSDRSGPVARHSFFRTIREVAESLANADSSLARAREAHAAHYAHLPIDPRHEGDLENLLRAHAHASDARHATEASRLALALESPLAARGRNREALDAFDRTLALVTEGDALAALHLGRGRALQDAGRTAESRADAELALRASEGHPLRQAESLLQLGALDDVTGDTESARECYERALALLAELEPSTDRERLQVRARRLRGHALRREGALDEALRLTEASVVGARALGDAHAEAAALYEKGVVQLFLGTTDATLATFARGLEVARTAELPVMEGAMKTARACLLQELGRFDEALRDHSDAARLFEASGSRHREGSALYYLGTTYLDRGEPEAALPVLERARERLAPVGAARYDALVSSALALACERLGDRPAADRERARAAEAAAKVSNEPALDLSVSLRGQAVEVLRGAEPALEAARAAVERHGTDDTRASLRALERAAAGQRAASTPALVVWSDGRAFQPPESSEPVALPDGSPLRGLLQRLARGRVESPAEWVPIDELLEAGWPGERMGAVAALNRLYVALSTLRKKGLRPYLEKGPGGYALTPGVPTRWA